MSKKKQYLCSGFSRVLPSMRKAREKHEKNLPIDESKTCMNMTRKRKQENLAYLLEIEQDMLSQGKRLSKAFYAAKKYAELALQ